MYVCKNVKYQITENNFNYTIFGKDNELPMVFNCYNNHKNVLKFEHNYNRYFLLLPVKFGNVCFFKISQFNTNFYITVSSNLVICTDKENILEVEVGNVTYSHYETMGNILLIYF